MEKGNLGTASNMGVCFATNHFAVPRVLAVGRPCLDLVDSSSYSASPFEITVLAAKNVWIVCVHSLVDVSRHNCHVTKVKTLLSADKLHVLRLWEVGSVSCGKETAGKNEEITSFIVRSLPVRNRCL